MQKLIIFLGVIGLGIGFAIWDNVASPNMDGKDLEFVKPAYDDAPDVAFFDLDGYKRSLHSFKGKTVILNVWATWCPPCVEEMPQLIELAKRGKDDVVLIALSVDEDKSAVYDFLKTFSDETKETLKQGNIVIAFDPDKSVSKDILGITQYPETLIIDENMKVQTHIKGVVDWLGSDTRHLLN